ncbi:MAG: hypothetical protein METHAR1v1_1250018, partial [Methanothrix sp.]
MADPCHDVDLGVDPPRQLHDPPGRHLVGYGDDDDPRLIDVGVSEDELLGGVAVVDRLAVRPLPPHLLRVHLQDHVGEISDPGGPSQSPTDEAVAHDHQMILPLLGDRREGETGLKPIGEGEVVEEVGRLRGAGDDEGGCGHRQDRDREEDLVLELAYDPRVEPRLGEDEGELPDLSEGEPHQDPRPEGVAQEEG